VATAAAAAVEAVVDAAVKLSMDLPRLDISILTIIDVHMSQQQQLLKLWNPLWMWLITLPIDLATLGKYVH
jgi:hypothetical protein